MAAEFLLKQEGNRRESRFGAERGGSAFFFASLILIILILMLWGGLAILNASRAAVREQIANQNKQKEENLRPELLNQVAVLDNRLRNVRTLLDGHVFSSNIFKAVEQDTHPQVRFTNFAFTADSRKVDMSGEAATYSVLSRQIGILERDPQVDRVEFGGLSSTEAKFVGFKLTVVFKPTLLGIRP